MRLHRFMLERGPSSLTGVPLESDGEDVLHGLEGEAS